MQITVTVKRTFAAEIDPSELGYAIERYLIESLPASERAAFDDAGNAWSTDEAGHVSIGAFQDWRPFATSKQTTALVDAANLLIFGELLKIPSDQGSLIYPAYTAECPNGHADAIYIPAIEVVRCPVCGLSDVSA